MNDNYSCDHLEHFAGDFEFFVGGNEENFYRAADGVDVSRVRPVGMFGMLGAMGDTEIQRVWGF